MVFIASWQHYLRMHISLLGWNANKGRKKVPRLEEKSLEEKFLVRGRYSATEKTQHNKKGAQQVSETVPENAP